MPIYEYRCGVCGFQSEHLQKAGDALLTTCPSCGKDAYSKLVSAAGFQLKGSGWYASDFKDSGKPPSKSTPEPSTSTAATPPAATGSGD